MMLMASKGAGLAIVAVLVSMVGLHAYWAAGGRWGLAAALGRSEVDPTASLRLAAAVVCIALSVASLGVLARVGISRLPIPWFVLKWGTWTLAAVLALVALANATSSTALEQAVFAPAALVLALLATLVARSPRPTPPS